MVGLDMGTEDMSLYWRRKRTEIELGERNVGQVFPSLLLWLSGQGMVQVLVVVLVVLKGDVGEFFIQHLNELLIRKSNVRKFGNFSKMFLLFFSLFLSPILPQERRGEGGDGARRMGTRKQEQC